MLTPEMESKMAKERVEYLKGDPNANNAEKGVKNAELEKAQWEKEAKKPEASSKPAPPKDSPPSSPMPSGESMMSGDNK